MTLTVYRFCYTRVTSYYQSVNLGNKPYEFFVSELKLILSDCHVVCLC